METFFKKVLAFLKWLIIGEDVVKTPVEPKPVAKKPIATPPGVVVTEPVYEVVVQKPVEAPVQEPTFVDEVTGKTYKTERGLKMAQARRAKAKEKKAAEDKKPAKKAKKTTKKPAKKAKKATKADPFEGDENMDGYVNMDGIE